MHVCAISDLYSTGKCFVDKKLSYLQCSFSVTSHTPFKNTTSVLLLLPTFVILTCVHHFFRLLLVHIPYTILLYVVYHARVYYRKKYAGGAKRETHAGAQVTSVMTVLRDEYRDQTTLRMKREVGTAKLLHGADLDKLTRFAQDREAWAVLVNHIKHRIQQQWVRKDGERKGRAAPWRHTPVLRVRVNGMRVPRREAVVPRLLSSDEVEAAA